MLKHAKPDASPSLPRLATMLAYSGTLPFIATAVIALHPIGSLDARVIALGYGAVIASFLCGIHWAVALFFAGRAPHNLLLTSNAVALLVWAALLIPPQALTLVLLAICFLYLLVIDRRLRNVDVLPEWFWQVRLRATGIVVLCLTTMILV